MEVQALTCQGQQAPLKLLGKWGAPNKVNHWRANRRSSFLLGSSYVQGSSVLVGGGWACGSARHPLRLQLWFRLCGTCAGFLAADTMHTPPSQEPDQHRSQRCAFSEVGPPRGNREKWVGQMAQLTEFVLQERGPEFYP